MVTSAARKLIKEAADAAKKAAELAKRRSKAAKKGAKTKAANRKAAEKAATKAEKAAKEARKKEHTGKSPVQNKPGVIKGKGYVAKEGAGVDPETGGSVDVARLVGTKGEKVSTGAGTRTRGFVDEQATKGKREVAKKYNAIAKKIDNKTASPAERKWYMQQAFKDADALKRQKGQNIKSKQTKSNAQKIRAAGGVDNYRILLDDGVVSDDMTINQIETAIRNVEARANLKKGTSTRAVMEALKEKAAQPKLARGRPLGKPRGHGGPELVAPKKPRKRKLSRGGLTKAGHKDYRKGGLFY
jgi:hypothetical protein